MSNWHGLIGVPRYAGGASGSVVLPAGAALIRVWCRSASGGTLTIFGGDAIPIVGSVPFDVDFKHALFVASAAAPSLVFTGTDSYFVHYVASLAA